MHIDSQSNPNNQWTANFAYAVGLITSDGHLDRDGRHISFTSKDIELIDNFKLALNLQNKILLLRSGSNPEKAYFRITFSDVVLYKFLNSIGIYAAKSHSIQEVKVPQEFLPDFLRGFFEGDGSFYSYFDRRWKNSLVYQIAFYSASLEFITWLKDILSKNFEVKGFIRKGDGVWALRYVKGDTNRLYKVMYYDKKQLLLTRKHDKMFQLINLPD